MLDVRSFGAVGDGVTDDTAALQGALDAAAESKSGVSLPEGVYVTSTLRLHAHTRLVGTPIYSYREFGGTILRLRDAQAGCLLDITGATGASLYGLNLDGGELGDGVHGIMFDRPSYNPVEDTLCIEHCRVNNFTGDGIHLNRVWCYSIRHCFCHQNRGNGIQQRGWDAFLLDNWLASNGAAGFGAYGENASVTMHGNRIEWNHTGGIVVRGGTHYNITGNYIDHSGGPGISLSACGEIPSTVFTITGNIIYRSGWPQWTAASNTYASTHVDFRNVRGLVFTGNTMNAGCDDHASGDFSPRFGIVCADLEDSIINNNVLYNGALENLMVDRGGHGANVEIGHNLGSLYNPANMQTPGPNAVFYYQPY